MERSTEIKWMSVGRLRRKTFTRCSGYFPIEKRLVLGLPDPQPWGHQGTWLWEGYWDFIIYANRLARSGTGRPTFYANPARASINMGLNSADYKIVGPTVLKKRIGELLPTLEGFGFVKATGDYKYGPAKSWKHPYYAVMLCPTVTSTGVVVSPLARTEDNLARQRRPFAMVPQKLMDGGFWKSLATHRRRRILVALYCFTDLVAFRGVDPNHLRVEGDDVLLASDAFLHACGCDIDELAGCLEWFTEGPTYGGLGVVSLVDVNVTLEPGSLGDTRLRYAGERDEIDDIHRSGRLKSVHVGTFRPLMQGEHVLARAGLLKASTI